MTAIMRRPATWVLLAVALLLAVPGGESVGVRCGDTFFR